VIRSFRDPDTELLFHRIRSKGLPADVQRVALRKLALLDAAESLQDLRVPPGNRSSRSRLIGLGSTAFGSTTAGASASCGETATPSMLKSSTTTSE